MTNSVYVTHCVFGLERTDDNVSFFLGITPWAPYTVVKSPPSMLSSLYGREIMLNRNSIALDISGKDVGYVFPPKVPFN